MATSTQWQLAREAAERYGQILVPAILGPAAQALVVWSRLQPGETVLDVGCGTGAAARFAAQDVGASGRVIGVDVNAGMLAVARSLPRVDGAPIEWKEGPARALPVDDASVDVVLCAQTLQFVSDRPGALSDIRRVLRPGGRLIVSLWGGIDDNPYFDALIDAIARRTGPGTAVGLMAIFNLSGTSDIHRLFEQTGWTHVEMTLRQLDLDLPPLREFVPRHIGATPMGPGFTAASPTTQQAVIEDVAQRLAAYETTGGVRVPFRTHLIRAVP